MNTSLKRTLLVVMAFTAVSIARIPSSQADNSQPKAIPGPFQPTAESFDKYECPEWFRDAKFGIWSHWGPDCIPNLGNDYANRMYRQGSPEYKWHLENYGHPTEVGYKDVIDSWKAEKFDPEALIARYKAAGAKYFVTMATHHDNYDCWDSTHHHWNSVIHGPKKDIVGLWREAVLEAGLRFGISSHGDERGWNFIYGAQGADKHGPLAGVPYDGTDPSYAELYNYPTSGNESPPDWWRLKWLRRHTELVNKYRPDLLYFDGDIPHGQYGKNLIAHYLNQNAQDHQGKIDAVVNVKSNNFVLDYERGVPLQITEKPWQNDTSLSGWFFMSHNPNVDAMSLVKDAPTIIHTLVDVVSKNGNLLINFPQRGDGSLYPECEVVLDALTEWMPIHGEGIYDTRPWLTFGEGPTKIKRGWMNEIFHPMTVEDIRFTQSQDGEKLYAFALGWPEDGKVLVRSLAKGAGKINTVELMGLDGKVDWQQTDEGLVVSVPNKPISQYTCAMRITGDDLKPVPVPEDATKVPADDSGNYVLKPDDASFKGVKIAIEEQAGQPCIGFWNLPEDSVAWTLSVDKPGKFSVSASVATYAANVEFVVEVAGKQLVGKAKSTGGWDIFRDTQVGSVQIDKAGLHVLTVSARDAKTWEPINLRNVKLVRSP